MFFRLNTERTTTPGEDKVAGLRKFYANLRARPSMFLRFARFRFREGKEADRVPGSERGDYLLRARSAADPGHPPTARLPVGFDLDRQRVQASDEPHERGELPRYVHPCGRKTSQERGSPGETLESGTSRELPFRTPRIRIGTDCGERAG